MSSQLPQQCHSCGGACGGGYDGKPCKYVSGVEGGRSAFQMVEEQDSRAAANFVPGVMHCAKCSFRLVRQNLYMQSGTIGPGDNKTEPCPNGCGPLWPVTWEQEARECWDRLGGIYIQPEKELSVEFISNGDSEAQFIADAERLNCPACGGSGHVDDVKSAEAQAAATISPLLDLAERAVPFLRDEGSKWDDDGSNEPLELAREIEAALSAAWREMKA